ncbi:papain fold toxin domain-containing protein [Anabaena sp. UHCC 0399]|uniref:papain fold toxin domain-containing protein n=1 Tax=Anabaena sp. UHCC 0399 TaxID=3110238 RepID=UPI002B211CE2|nr:papain fold toxin domain-containing protein [Anabaena sp. UHCC 0399]MEA5567346.1 papain fold toxin domain-containing protein [Anabaena sp. UHCC 0399]
MSSLSTEEIYQALGNISSQFGNLECDKCAIALKAWSDGNGIEAKILKLRTKKRNDFFIISDRYGDSESITDNGIHYGVEVLGLVFDNLSPQGLPLDEWINDFSCRSGEFYLEELDNF